MPATDVDNIIIIGAESGHARVTKSWVLGRLLRDFNGLVDESMGDERAHQCQPGGAVLWQIEALGGAACHRTRGRGQPADPARRPKAGLGVVLRIRNHYHPAGHLGRAMDHSWELGNVYGHAGRI